MPIAHSALSVELRTGEIATVARKLLFSALALLTPSRVTL
jgi:hypothetical protein